MSFFSGLEEQIFKEFETGVKDFRYMVVNNKIFYLEGHLKLASLSEDEIKVSVGKKVCTLRGSSLKIAELTPKTIKIEGSIVEVSVI